MSWRPCKLSHLVSWMSENDASGENTNGAISSVDLSSCLLVQSEHHAVSHSTSMSRLTSKHLAVHYLLIMQKSQVCYYTNGLQRHGHKGNCFWTIYRGHGYSPEPIYIYIYLSSIFNQSHFAVFGSRHWMKIGFWTGQVTSLAWPALSPYLALSSLDLATRSAHYESI